MEAQTAGELYWRGLLEDLMDPISILHLYSGPRLSGSFDREVFDKFKAAYRRAADALQGSGQDTAQPEAPAPCDSGSEAWSEWFCAQMANPHSFLAMLAEERRRVRADLALLDRVAAKAGLL